MHEDESLVPPEIVCLAQAMRQPFISAASLWSLSLSLDQAGKNLAIGSTDDNVYVKLAESSVSVRAILSEIGRKTSTSEEELVLLDSKFLPVSDGKVR